MKRIIWFNFFDLKKSTNGYKGIKNTLKIGGAETIEE